LLNAICSVNTQRCCRRI